MRTVPLLSLASGVMPEATPLQLIDAAAIAGYASVGLWIDVELFDSAYLREVKSALDATGLSVLDAEVVWIRPGPLDPSLLRVIDIAAELKARHILVVSSDPDLSATVGKFVQLCEHAIKYPLKVVLEYGAFTDVPRLQVATQILRQAAQANQGILVDTLHWFRSGGTREDLLSLPRNWVSYAQLCDASFNGPNIDERAAVRQEAVDFRLCPGDGGLPLVDMLAGLPAGIPLSLEIRSLALRTAYPDLAERARVVLNRTHLWFDSIKISPD